MLEYAGMPQNAPSNVVFENVVKTYSGAATRAVDGFTLTVEPGEFLVLVGPSGCGKSTTLRMVAGLESVTSGKIFIAGRDVTREAPKNRDIAMVFQNYALYPHMTVRENMAFALKLRGYPKAEIASRVEAAAERLGLAGYMERLPKALSGGQRQRVALGRAIVRNPAVFLFDEPLSNLDAKMRVEMRGEIIKLHRHLGATMIYVTHDQVEAMTMASRIVVMNEGRIEQVAAPQELYRRPRTVFAARFIGTPPMNIFPPGFFGPKTCGLRPEYIEISPDSPLSAKVEFCEALGSETIVHCRIKDMPLAVRTGGGVFFNPGETVNIKPDMSKIVEFDETFDA